MIDNPNTDYPKYVKGQTKRGLKEIWVSSDNQMFLLEKIEHESYLRGLEIVKLNRLSEVTKNKHDFQLEIKDQQIASRDDTIENLHDKIGNFETIDKFRETQVESLKDDLKRCRRASLVKDITIVGLIGTTVAVILTR